MPFPGLLSEGRENSYFILRLRKPKPRKCVYFTLVTGRSPGRFRTRTQILYSKFRKNLVSWVRESELRKQRKEPPASK